MPPQHRPPPPGQGNAPGSRQAPHVQKAVSALQAKPAQTPPPAGPAPHVRRAVAAVQAKAKPAPAERSPALHVQAALRGGAQPGIQRATPPGTGTRQPAPHVQAALSRGLQAKAQPPGPRPPAPHVRAAIQGHAVQGRLSTIRGRAGGPLRVIQRIPEEEAKKLVEEIRSEMPYGPGNLSEKEIPKELAQDSGIPVEARQRFNLATNLMFLLVDHREKRTAIADALCRLAMKEPPKETSVFKYVNLEETPLDKALEVGELRKEIKSETIRELESLADIILFDFVRQKTGGGSCDHYSAGMFLRLAREFPKAKISIDKYAPELDSEYKITPPEDAPYHRVVFLEDEDGQYMFDPWWPAGKVIQVPEEHQKVYAKRETVLQWNPDHMEFVKAFWSELEHHYQEAVEKQLLLEKPKDSVSVVWTLSRNL